MSNLISSLVAWVVGKTTLIRNLAVTAAGALVSIGVLAADSQETFVAGVVVLITGILNFVVDRTKEKSAKDVQEALHDKDPSVAVDGYIGPRTAAAAKSALCKCKE